MTTTPGPDDSPYAPASHLSWRILHSHVVDAVLAQAPDECRGVQLVLGGMRLADFQRAVVDDGSRVRIRALIEDSGDLAYRVEVLTDFGDWQGLTRPTAAALGMDPDEALAAEQWAWKVRPDADLPPDPEDQA